MEEFIFLNINAGVSPHFHACKITSIKLAARALPKLDARNVKNISQFILLSSRFGVILTIKYVRDSGSSVNSLSEEKNGSKLGLFPDALKIENNLIALCDVAMTSRF